MTRQLDRAKTGVARLIDGYADGLLTKEEFAPRLERLRQRVGALEEQLAQQRAERVVAAELQQIVGRLEALAERVRAGLDTADRAMQREIILALVRRVDVDDRQVRVVFKVSPPPPGDDDHALQHRPHDAREESFQGTERLALGLPFADPPVEVGSRPGRVARLRQRDAVENRIQAAVAAAV